MLKGINIFEQENICDVKSDKIMSYNKRMSYKKGQINVMLKGTNECHTEWDKSVSHKKG